MVDIIKQRYNAGDYESIVRNYPNEDALVGLTPKELMMIAWAHHHRLNATIKNLSGIERNGIRALIISITDEVMNGGGDKEDKISALKLEPLHLWGLGFEERAISRVEAAIALYPEDSGIWNTRALLELYGKKFQECATTSAVVIGLAVVSRDFRTAGNGSRQMAIAVKEASGCVSAAAGWLSQAIDFWRKSQEETGWDAKIHIKGAVDLARRWGCIIR